MLRLKVTAGRGRGLYADVSIRAGTELFACEPFASVAFPGFCSCGSNEGKACTSCKQQRYCSTRCQKAEWAAAHKAECKLLAAAAAHDKEITPTLRLVLRVLNRLQAEGEAQPALEAPAEGVLLTPALQQHLNSAAGVTALESNRSLHPEDLIHEHGQMSALLLSVLKEVNTPPTATAKDGKAAATAAAGTAALPSPQLLMDLFCKIRCNVFTLCDGELRPWGVGLYPLGALLNHSCSPNAIALFRDNKLVVRSIRPIEAGQEVCISYIDVAEPTPIRRTLLSESYFFNCDCERCHTFGAYVAQHGPIGPAGAASEGSKDGSGLQPLPLEAFSAQDRRMLGVRCGMAGCRPSASSVVSPSAGASSALPPAAPVGGLHVLEVYERAPEHPSSGAGEDEDSGSRRGQIMQTLLQASACTQCGCSPSQALYDHVKTVLTQIDRAVNALKQANSGPESSGANGGSSKRVGAVGAAKAVDVFKRAEDVFEHASAALTPEHHRLVALLNGLTNAAISMNEWETAIAYNQRFLESSRTAHPAGNPMPALQESLQGKLLLFVGRAQEAMAHLRSALSILSVSHSEGHPMVQHIQEMLLQATTEANVANNRD